MTPDLVEPIRHTGRTPERTPVRSAAFTIVSRNYFHFALNLMASVARHMPGVRRVVAICDTLDGLVSPDPGIELVGVEALGMPQLNRMAVYYTILELNTAIKPSVFRWLFDNDRADGPLDKVIYFDPDIQLYGSGKPLLDRLDSADVVLTPHLLAPLDDDRHPSDLQILQSGTYNLGFVALHRSADTEALLRWWQRKLLRDCVVDIPRGLFTDQKWMDLVPGFFQRAHIERHPGWNVAYWNLLHRRVEVDDQAHYTVNGQPLFFFHYSGHDPKSGSVSKHQDRFQMADCSPAVRQLYSRYLQDLALAGRERYAALPYAYAKLADGTPLPDSARRALRLHLEPADASVPDLRSREGARWVIDFLTAPVDGITPPITRIAQQLYEDRADLRTAFPDMLGTRRDAYRGWFAERAGPESGIAGVLARGMVAGKPAAVTDFRDLRDVRDVTDTAIAAAGVAPTTSAAVSATAAMPATSAPATAAPNLYRYAYRAAWKARHVLRPLTSVQLRMRLRQALLLRAYPVSAAPVPAAAAPTTLPAGVTLIGYVKAESGVGESARATLRALATTTIPHSVIDFRTGNVARMAEAVDESLITDGRQHQVSLFHINADQLPVARTFLGEAAFTGTYRIGFWAWELENFPEPWHAAFGHVDEVWVPSTFCQRAIAAPSPVPVVVIPHAVQIPDELKPDRARFGLRNSSVTFLAMADMMSMAGRKNPFAAVEAFASAFTGRNDNVQMIVKIGHAARDPEAHARLRTLAAACPGIILIDEPMDRTVLNTLLDSVDCFVSLHRAEGFGLVIAEAMARAKVVVATGWSGNMDFMNHHNALPVDYRLATLESDAGPYLRGERWAEPSHDDAVDKLRQVADDAALRQRIGQRARRDCAAQLAPEVVGRAMQARLEKVMHI